MTLLADSSRERIIKWAGLPRGLVAQVPEGKDRIIRVSQAGEIVVSNKDVAFGDAYWTSPDGSEAVSWNTTTGVIYYRGRPAFIPSIGIPDQAAILEDGTGKWIVYYKHSGGTLTIAKRRTSPRLGEVVESDATVVFSGSLANDVYNGLTSALFITNGIYKGPFSGTASKIILVCTGGTSRLPDGFILQIPEGRVVETLPSYPDLGLSEITINYQSEQIEQSFSIIGQPSLDFNYTDTTPGPSDPSFYTALLSGPELVAVGYHGEEYLYLTHSFIHAPYNGSGATDPGSAWRFTVNGAYTGTLPDTVNIRPGYRLQTGGVIGKMNDQTSSGYLYDKNGGSALLADINQYELVADHLGRMLYYKPETSAVEPLYLTDFGQINDNIDSDYVDALGVI